MNDLSGDTSANTSAATIDPAHVDPATLEALLRTLRTSTPPASTARSRSVKWDHMTPLSLARPGDIDKWFVSFEARLRAAQIQEAAWPDLFMQCPVVDEAVKAQIPLEDLTYVNIRQFILRNHGPTDPVNYYRSELAHVSGGDRVAVRDKLTALLTLHNRAAADVGREPWTTKDLCYSFCHAFPPATRDVLIKQFAIACRLPDTFELLFKQAPEAPASEPHGLNLAPTLEDRIITLLDRSLPSATNAPPRTAPFQRTTPGQKRPFPDSRWASGRRPLQHPRRGCPGCGRECTERTSCPAWGKTCGKCGKTNHFQAVCRSGSQVEPRLFRPQGEASK